MRHPFSIRALLLLTVGVLTALIALLVANEVYQQWERLERIHTLKTATLISDPLFDAMERLSVERDMAYSLLFTDDPALAQTLRPRLENSRKEADATLAATLQRLSAYDFPGLEEQIRMCHAQFAALQKTRGEIDAALALPLGQREPGLAGRWFDEVTAVTLQTENVWLEFIKHFREVDPVVSLQMRFKYDLRAIMENSGRERALIGRLIMQNADASPAEQARLLRWQGGVDEAWIAADSLAEQGKLYPAITPAFKEAKSHYDNVYGMVQDIFYVPGAKHGENYPFAADFWFEISEETTDSFYELKNAVIKETHAYLDVLEARAQQVILWHAALLALTFLLCLYSFRVITYRVIRPINGMVTALVDTTEGKAVTLPPANRDDEIGKLAQVLHAFQKNMEELQQAQKQLQAAHKYLDDMLNHIPDPIFMKDRQHRWIGGNKAFWELMDGPPEKFIGKSDYDFFPKEEADVFWEKDDHVLNSGEEYTNEEFFTGSKGVRHVLSTKKVAFRNEREEMYLVGVIRDITEIKTTEGNLLRYTHALERSNKELDDFAYIASHDLKEPLRGLFNHATFLLEDYQDKLDEDGVRKLHRLSYLAQRMERLVNDLLYFSRLGRQDLAIQSTDMNEVIHDIENTLDVFLQERNAHISIANPLPTVTCDKTRITEAFRNLITNAVKYNDNPEKSVEIGFLETYASANGIMLNDVFYVKDNGKGIAPEFHEEIFRIFKRLQSSKDTKEEGTGAGLTFVKKIIERHGGKIWLESQLGKGTTFYFTLKG